MIFDAIVNFLMSIFEGVLGLFPAFGVDLGGLGFGLGTALAGANSWFPITTLGACIAVVLGVRFYLFGVTFVTWIWDKIPFKFS